MAIRSRSRAVVATGALVLLAFCVAIAFFGPHEHPSPPPSSSSIESYHLPPPLSASLPSSSSSSSSHQRRLSEALPNGGCKITWPEKPDPNIQITYAASYPGCGARMTWNLVEALTGLQTGDDWNNNGRGAEVVTVKTHYPQSNGILVDFDEKIGRAFIVIRNPIKSIPSFFNHIYEMRNHLPVHSERAPLEEWLKWRNAYIETEISEYKKFICYWMDRYTPENRLLITYEGLTDDLIGAEVTKGLNEFLGMASGVTTIERESVPCIWRAVVKNEPPPQQKAQIEKLQSMAKNQPQNAPPVVQQPQQQQQQQQIVEVMAEDPLDVQLREAQAQLQQAQLLIQQQQGAAAPALTVEQQLAQTQSEFLALQQQQQQGLQPGLRRRLDPGHHNSQRKGPEVPRPYTPQQLDSMMNMLLEVGERYHKQDVRLYHIMMGYYEKIREERLRLSPDGASVAQPPGGLY